MNWLSYIFVLLVGFVAGWLVGNARKLAYWESKLKDCYDEIMKEYNDGEENENVEENGG